MTIEVLEVGGNLLKNGPKAERIVVGSLREALNKASGLLYRAVLDETPTSTGTLKKAMARDFPEPLAARIFPQVQYALYVHEGTRPHGIPAAELGPGGSLARWAKKKGLNPYAVAKSIAVRGTKANPWMARTAERERPNVERELAGGLDDAARNLVS